MVFNFLLKKRNQNYLATLMQIGQEMLTLADQHQAMCFRLEVELSAGEAGNNRQLPSHPLKQNMLL